MVLDLVVIGVAINLGPLHNSAFILLLSAPRGVRKGLAFILAWLGCLVLVLAAVILLTGGKPPAPRSAPSTLALALKLLLGLGMVAYAELKRRRRNRPRRTPKWLARLDSVSGWTAAGLGVILQPWGLVAAGAATVVQAHLTSLASYVALLVFCLLATCGLLAMELYATFRPARARSELAALREWMESHQDQVIVTLSLLAGFWLVAKSLYQLV
ncbi:MULTISPECIES: GAP family protein [unclassified Streptomyces]|uniref:GAP family protein n=1 Tax=unclassified Streptomyces TaxID=2593676 RepID=UPI00224EB692|nr:MULTISPECIES: GAP family protein [unclassified Streptomyces]MCX5144603.1 GAP family protein [Streptomyces sp. NBC_00338]WRZ68966.1 GAP family protein [Streptomyces sp. NBC_01257]WSU62916.1 GAP family protein [Streptomyces sp. NBC_01104]